MRELFLYYAGIGFLLGVLGGVLLVVSWPVAAATGLGGLALALIAGVARESPYRTQIGLLAVALVFMLIGITRVEYSTWWSEPPSSLARQVGADVELQGRVVFEPDERSSSQQLTVLVAGERVLVLADRFSTVSYGDTVSVRGVLERPTAFTTDLGRTFNYPGYLEARGIHYLVRFGDVTVVETDGGNPLISVLLAGKQQFQTALRTVLNEPMVGLAEGLLLGEKRALGAELTEVFRRTGIIHIVVLSGYNVLLVVLFISYLSGYLVPERARLGVNLLAIAAFALLVGLSPTVTRASLMAALALVAVSTGLVYLVLRGLLLSGVVMVAISPALLVYDPGFQLSFLATFGLIVAAPWLEARLQALPNWLQVREFLVATVVTQLFVLPLLLYQIGEVSLVSIVVNVLVLPMVPVAMFLTFLTGLLAMVAPGIAVYVAALADLALRYIIVVAETFAGIPLAAVSVPTFSVWWVVVLYLGLGYVSWRLLRSGQKPVVTAPAPSSQIDISHWTITESSDSKRPG